MEDETLASLRYCFQVSGQLLFWSSAAHSNDLARRFWAGYASTVDVIK